jgi:hypothetical protein
MTAAYGFIATWASSCAVNRDGDAVICAFTVCIVSNDELAIIPYRRVDSGSGLR